VYVIDIMRRFLLVAELEEHFLFLFIRTHDVQRHARFGRFAGDGTNVLFRERPGFALSSNVP